MSDENKISQDDKDWLDVIAGKPVENTNPETLQEASLLREALLRKYYEETLEPQPIKLGDELAKRFQKEAPLPPLAPPFWKNIIQKINNIGKQLLANPIPVMATACLMMLLHIPLYISNPQQEEPELVARSDNSPYKDSRSSKVPLAEVEEFVFQIHLLGVGTQVTPQAGGRWLLQFSLDPEQLNKATYRQPFIQFLQSKNQPLPPFDSTLEVELLFIPLIEGKAIESYPYSLSNAPPEITTAEAFANYIQQYFNNLGVKGKVGQQTEQFYIDLWFPETLSIEIEEAMDEYRLNKNLLTPKHRQLRINIIDK